VLDAGEFAAERAAVTAVWEAAMQGTVSL
jgi:hypothetical protein